MDSFVYLIILYVIFSLISSTFSKKKKAVIAQKTQQRTPPPALPKQKQQRTEPVEEKLASFLREKLDFQVPKDVLSLDDDEIEPVEELLPRPAFTKPPPLPKHVQPSAKPAVRQKRSGILPQTSNRYLQGIILSEILGPPVSKRKRT